MPGDAGDAALSLSREDLVDVVTRAQGLSDIDGWDQGEAAILAGLIEEWIVPHEAGGRENRRGRRRRGWLRLVFAPYCGTLAL